MLLVVLLYQEPVLISPEGWLISTGDLHRQLPFSLARFIDRGTPRSCTLLKSMLYIYRNAAPFRPRLCAAGMLPTNLFPLHEACRMTPV